MRHVYSDISQIAHLWANELQSDARNSCNTFYFAGSSIYSYGSHFKCGEIVRNRKGERAYVLNTDKYSRTTEKHKNAVHTAIPDGERILYTFKGEVPRYYGDKLFGHHIAITAIACFVGHIIEMIGKQSRAVVSDYSNTIIGDINQIRSWIEFWELDKQERIPNPKTCSYKIRKGIFQLLGGSIDKAAVALYNATKETRFTYSNEEIVEVFQWLHNHGAITPGTKLSKQQFLCVVKELVADHIGAEWYEKCVEIIKKRKRNSILADRQKLKDWHNRETMYWYPKADFIETYGWHTALRLCNGGKAVETSKHIKISVDEAYRLWRIVKVFENTGVFTHQLAMDINGTQWKFNSYQNHVLTAGCHKIPFSEMKAIAIQLGFTK